MSVREEAASRIGMAICMGASGMGTATVSCKDAAEGMTGAGSVSLLVETEAKAVSLLAGIEAKAVSLTEDNKVSARSANWDCAAAMPDGIADKIMTKALIFPNFINLLPTKKSPK